MHENDVPFLTTMSENMHYGTIASADHLKCHSLEFELKKVIRSHAVRCFRAALLVVDIQFKPLKDRNLLDIVINVVSKEEHVTKVNRWHRVIKERSHCYYAILPFNYLP